jgi:class 3 adenylate cyclase/pimeloyl-ACP methyl ester carboxylesterase
MNSVSVIVFMGTSAIQYTTAVDGVAIAYEALGTGPPLLYARAWISNLELQRRDPAVERFFTPLREHRTIVRYDTRGNGMSEWDLPNPITIEDLLADLEAVADTIEEPSFDLWGTTYAGPLVIEYTARHPERVNRLILDGTFMAGRHWINEAAAQPFFQMLNMVHRTPEVVFSSLSFMTDPSPEITHEVRVNRLKSSIDPGALEQLYRLAFAYDVGELLPEIMHPVLVMHREGSRAVPVGAARRLTALLPNATLQILQGDAHNLYQDDWQAPLDAVASFLELGPMSHRISPIEIDAPTELQVVLFTDIVGSTAMTAALGDHPAQSVVREHDRIVRSALADRTGREIKHTGDGIMASFRSVSDAAGAALLMRDQIANLARERPDHPLAIRVGLNAGEPVAEGGDLFGSTVQIAARVCDRAGTGEVVVTDVVRELLRGKQMRFDDFGLHDMKGVDGSIRLWRLDAASVAN